LAGEYGDFAYFVVPNKDSDWCYAGLALSKDMAKPGNLLNAIKEYFVRPQPAFFSE
jgi:hypothetical protein